MSSVNPTANDKKYLRSYFSDKRRKLCDDADRKKTMDEEIQTRLIISREYRSCDTVLIYMAQPKEIATSMIIRAALANNKRVGLPVCLDDGRMEFRRIYSLSQLHPGRFNISEPDDSCEVIVPDERTLCVCPCLCCDLHGSRLGYGGGYYDRYLASFPGCAAALCYSDSVIPSIESEDFDIKMNVIHTDSFSRYI
nr:5-formyltetrahydrofolate cyclo-ligase [uncultured Ruminococcus sp.]